MSDKMNLYCVGEGRVYEESNLYQKNKQLQQQIIELQKQQAVIEKLTPVFNQEKGMEVSFHAIEHIALTEKWYKDSEKEEVFVFDIQADTDAFPVLFEYVGREDFVGDSVYHLHAPLMEKEQLALVEAIVLEQFKHNSIIVTHQYASLQEQLDKKIKTLVCMKDGWIADDEIEEEMKITKGEPYRMVIYENGVILELTKNYKLFVREEDMVGFFPIDFRKESSVFDARKEEPVIPDILLCFDAFLEEEMEKE